jgi:glucose-1-phosphatase
LALIADQIRVVLFDVGGVLVELTGVATIQQWRPEFTAEEIWRRWLHSPTVRAFESGRMDAECFAAGVVRELEIDVAPAQFLSAFASWVTAPFPGAHDLLKRIPIRYRRALLSNSNSIHWPRVSDEMAFGDAVDHCFVSHLTGVMKPDAEAFQHALRALQCTPQEAIFLDDNLINVEAAQRLGIHATVVRGAAEAEQALGNAGIFD